MPLVLDKGTYFNGVEMTESVKDEKNREWKKHLLRSGAPLEYEVARILDNEGMFIDADFSFLRRDGSVEKEFSVDIVAEWSGGERFETSPFDMVLAVECKYRSREKSLVFFLDP